MKIIVINPHEKTVAIEKVDTPIRSFKTQFAEPRQIGRLPNGDTLWADTDRIHLPAFSLGNSQQVVGTGLLVGKKDDAGDFTDPRSDIESIRPLIRFCERPAFEIETTPEAITPSIDAFVRDLRSEQAAYVRVAPALGARAGRCWENVSAAVRSYGGERVHGWTIWERPGLFLTSEFHAVWCTPDRELIDVTPKVDGERRILFSADRPRYPAHFNFMQRPGNRRFRLYRIQPDVSATIEQLSSSKKAYEIRQATKRGLSLDRHLASKIPLDALEEAIERLFAVCIEIDSLVEVTFDGMTSKQPHRVARLDAEKMSLHDEILRLARQRLEIAAPASQGPEANA